MIDRLLTAGEVAERLSVPESWVREHTRNGRLPHIELGRYRRYVWSDVLAYLDQQKAGAAPGAAFRKHQPSTANGAGAA